MHCTKGKRNFIDNIGVQKLHFLYEKVKENVLIILVYIRVALSLENTVQFLYTEKGKRKCIDNITSL